MEFRKYQHVERFGTTEVDGIEFGDCYVFPKLDGSNGSVWVGCNGKVKAGSRNRELSADDDHAGFYDYVQRDKRIQEYLQQNPRRRLYGEWLVPHTVKTYRDDAWRRFYVYDVCLDDADGNCNIHIPYQAYQEGLEEFELDYLAPLAVVRNGKYEDFLKLLERNTCLIKDGEGIGEGIVIKNYEYYNRFGRQTWAKIVSAEFKERHVKEMGVPKVQSSKVVEEAILDEYCTKAFIDKEYAKIVAAKGGWQSRYIPELLGRVWSELVKEECWNIVKKHKNPKIDFKTLNHLVVRKIKQVKPELF